ncbi:EI24 domain-containing protein [Microbacterium pseudoresistens]|uniref:CysZ protein n=1 Tax=Microbacterium pseudoresistens TaxID=640634 RepID=A0A7Y9ETH5_9MICO|nr:EI24 domain-containing protein [Microbacterium pseudoresistens]NYD53655.1 CysZ protein [Microbacterium pseudoresistens]
MISEFAAGIGTLLRGAGFWKKRPGLMSLGLVPALIAAAVLLAALIPLAAFLGPISDAVTPFADGWADGWRAALRIAVSAVILIAALALAAAVFTALALVIGDPFYQRIWRAVEEDRGSAPAGEGSFWTTVGEGLRLVITGLLVSILVLLVGLIPVIGGIAAAVLGVVLTGRVLARELTGRAFDARDLDSQQRAALIRGGRARTLGFGAATQLCFLIPLGAVLVMPAAVAGATMMARDLLDRSPSPTASLPADGAPPHA